MSVVTAPLLWMAALVSVMGSVGADSRPIHGTLDGLGLVFTTEDGVRCSGELVKMTKDGGLGSVLCSDGRKGSFDWTITGPGLASADGWLAGEPLELTFTLG